MKKIVLFFLLVFVFISLSGCITTTHRIVEFKVRLPRETHRHVSALLGDGTIGVFGGWEAGKHDNVLLVDLSLKKVRTLSVETNWSGTDMSGISLKNGNVLLVDGGYEAVYDFRKKKTLITENRLEPDYIRWATLTQLNSDRVLISGGYTSGFKPISSWAIFDPSKNSFVRFGKMSIARALHTATLLEDGRILIAGGAGEDYTERSFDSAEILDLSTGKSMLLPDRMSHCRNGHDGILLDNGMVLLIGGYWPKHDPPYNTICELFDPKMMKFRDTGAIGRGRYCPLACKLDGEVIVIGGDDEMRVVEVYDPKKEQFYIGEQLLKQPRQSGFTVTKIDSKSFAIIGGRVNDEGQVLNTIEIVTKRYVIRPRISLIKIGRYAEIGTDEIDAIVQVYKKGKLIDHIPIEHFQQQEYYFEDNPILENLKEKYGEVENIALVVSFSESCSYSKRVNLLHLLGLSNIENISVGNELRAHRIRKKERNQGRF